MSRRRPALSWLGILEPPERPDQGLMNRQAEHGYGLLRRKWREGLAGEGANERIFDAGNNLPDPL